MNHFCGISSSRDIFLESGGNKKIKWGSLFLIWSGLLGYYRRKSVPKDQLSLALVILLAFWAGWGWEVVTLIYKTQPFPFRRDSVVRGRSSNLDLYKHFQLWILSCTPLDHWLPKLHQNSETTGFSPLKPHRLFTLSPIRTSASI